jgi:hypothetical protein
MSCPPSEELLPRIDGAYGEEAKQAADSHVEGCLSCQHALAEIIEAQATLTQYFVQHPPASSGGCPDSEDLLAWLESHPLESRRDIEAHLARCESCAHWAALARLALATPPETVETPMGLLEESRQMVRPAPVKSSPSLSYKILALAGAHLGLLLGIFSASGPASARLDFVSRRPPVVVTSPQPLTVHVRLRLRGDQGTQELALPLGRPLRISSKYEYGLRVQMNRDGWLHVFRVTPGGQLERLFPVGRALQTQNRLRESSEVLLPSAMGWYPVGTFQGVERIYAAFSKTPVRAWEESGADTAAASRLVAEMAGIASDDLTILGRDRTVVGVVLEMSPATGLQQRGSFD